MTEQIEKSVNVGVSLNINSAVLFDKGNNELVTNLSLKAKNFKLCLYNFTHCRLSPREIAQQLRIGL